MNIYKQCPIYEDDTYLLRMFEYNDCADLLRVYSDKNALPFFNSDNCDGDNFYYTTEAKMKQVLDFWKYSYENKWFVRFSIVEKISQNVIGTVELCSRVSQDEFNNMAILRVDVRSDYEKENVLLGILNLIVLRIKEIFDVKGVITKVPIYAIERMAAVKKIGFVKSQNYLIGKQNYSYDGYWELFY